MKVNFYKTTPRFLEIVAGLVMVIAALVLTLAVVVGFNVMLGGDASSRDLWTLIVCALGGSGCWLLAWRLLSGRGRRDGGLFSPLFLRVSSLIFVAGGLIMAVRHPLGFLEAVPVVAGAGACIGLARLRERHIAQREGSEDDR